jgi:hypothetical protein
MRVSNPDRPPLGIDSGNAAPTPTGFAEIVSGETKMLLAGHLPKFILRLIRRGSRCVTFDVCGDAPCFALDFCDSRATYCPRSFCARSSAG